MKRTKPIIRLRDRDQVPTVPVTIRKIMSDPRFARGVADARAGRGYSADYDTWATNNQWAYERGRQWAKLAPCNLPLKINGELNPLALRYGDSIGVTMSRICNGTTSYAVTAANTTTKTVFEQSRKGSVRAQGRN